MPLKKKEENEDNEEAPSKVTFIRKREKKQDGKKELPKKDAVKGGDKGSIVKLSFADDEEY